MINIFQIKDYNNKNLSAKQTYIRENCLKLKYSTNNKTLWKFIKVKDGYYIKNIYFKFYLTLKDNKIILCKKKQTIWSIDNGYLKTKNIFLDNSLKVSKTPYKWIFKPVDYNNKKYLAYIGYGLGGGVVVLLCIYMIYNKVFNSLLLFYIYLICIIYLLLYIKY